MQKQVSLKAYLVTVTILLIVLFVSLAYVRSQSEIGIGGGSFLTERDYIVYEDGSTTYMCDGSTGVVSWGSPNSSAVIDAVFTNMTSGRISDESVFIKDAIEISTPIFIPSWTTLEVEGQLKLADGADCDMLRPRATMYNDAGNVTLTADCANLSTTVTLSQVDHLGVGDGLRIADTDDGDETDYFEGLGHVAEITAINTATKVVTFTPQTNDTYWTNKSAQAFSENHCIIVKGGVWHGNFDGQTDGTSDVIHFESHVNSYPQPDTSPRMAGARVLHEIEFHDVYVTHPEDCGFFFNHKYANGQTVGLHDCSSQIAGGGSESSEYGIHAEHVYDSSLRGGMWDGSTNPIWLQDSFVDCQPEYVNGEVYLRGSWLDWSCPFHDCGNHTALILENFQYGRIHDSFIRTHTDAGTSFPAIKLQKILGYSENDASRWNTIDDVVFGGNWSTAIEEVDSEQDYNIYASIQASDCYSTIPFVLRGVNSQVSNTEPKVENTGTATFSGDNNVTVAHGLMTTPTFVSLTGGAYTFSYYGGYVTNLNSTHFMIAIQTGRTFTGAVYWEAKYEP